MESMVYSPPMKSKPDISLPLPAVLDEIESLRHSFREALDACSARMDADLDTVRDKVASLENAKKIPGGCSRDLRDMLTLLRGRKANSEKGRIKDLKKFHTLAEDLAMLSEGW